MDQGQPPTQKKGQSKHTKSMWNSQVIPMPMLQLQPGNTVRMRSTRSAMAAMAPRTTIFTPSKLPADWNPILQLERTPQINEELFIGMPIEMRSIIGRIHTSHCNVLKDSLVTTEHLTHLFEPVSLYLRKCTCMCFSVYVISVTSDF